MACIWSSFLQSAQNRYLTICWVEILFFLFEFSIWLWALHLLETYSNKNINNLIVNINWGIVECAKNNNNEFLNCTQGFKRQKDVLISDRKFSVSVSVSAEISVSVWLSVSVSVKFKLSVSAEISVQNATETKRLKSIFQTQKKAFS